MKGFVIGLLVIAALCSGMIFAQPASADDGFGFRGRGDFRGGFRGGRRIVVRRQFFAPRARVFVPRQRVFVRRAPVFLGVDPYCPIDDGGALLLPSYGYGGGFGFGGGFGY